MASVALRAGSPSNRNPNSGLGTGSAPEPSAPSAISSEPVSPSRRARRLGSHGGRPETVGRAPSSSAATMPIRVASSSDGDRAHPWLGRFALRDGYRQDWCCENRRTARGRRRCVAPSTGDGRTREAVARLLMEQGPITAAAVAAALELSAPGVRRHLDALIADGEAEVREASRRGSPRSRPAGPAVPAHRRRPGPVRARLRRPGRGRPALPARARRRGRGARLRQRPGARADRLQRGPGRRGRHPGRPGRRAGQGAHRPRLRGPARAAGSGMQLCQHHCPVAHVAAEFPVLCEAETAAVRGAARHPRATAGHHRARRLRVHHPRSAGCSRSSGGATTTHDPGKAGSPHDDRS